MKLCVFLTVVGLAWTPHHAVAKTTSVEANQSSFELPKLEKIMSNINDLSYTGCPLQTKCEVYLKRHKGMLMARDVVAKQLPISRPMVSAECLAEVEKRNPAALSDEYITGYHPGGSGSMIHSPIVPAKILGRLNVTAIGDLELSEMTECYAMTFPQFVYFLTSGRIAKLQDACLDGIQPGLLYLLTPYLIEELFKAKPYYVTLRWREFNPSHLVETPSVISKILVDSSRSFLCCSLLLTDFANVGCLAGVSYECIANMAAGSKCKNLHYSWFSSAPRPQLQLGFNDSSIIKVSPDLPDVSSLRLPTPPVPSDRVFKATRRTVLEMMSDSGFDNLPTPTKLAIWVNFNDTELNQHMVTDGRRERMETLIAQNPDIAARVLHVDNLSSPSSPLMAYGSDSSGAVPIPVLGTVILGTSLSLAMLVL